MIKKPKIEIIDLVSLIVHLIICLFFWISYKYELIRIDNLKSWIHGYFFGLPLILMGIFFRRLQNIRFYFIWIVVGILQLILYFIAKDNPDFLLYRGTGLSGLKALLPVLLMYQFLRQISLKVYKREMIISIRQGRMSFYEEEENRNMTWIEVLFSLILVGTSLIFGSM